MGSYSLTCCVSGLPIESGDPVRYFLITESPYADQAVVGTLTGFWFPRTFPLRARYNDYGSVEDVQDGPERDIWMEGFQIDLIKRGWDKNTCHDVPTHKKMAFNELLVALQEARVLVYREVPFMMSEGRSIRLPPEITRKLKALGHPMMPTPKRERVHGRPLAVRQAMIREDVWKTLSKIGMMSLQDPGDVGAVRNAVPFTVGLATHVSLMAEKGPIDAPFVETVGEFLGLHNILAMTRYQWRPSDSGGPQFGEWPEHVKVLQALLRVAQAGARRQRKNAQ